MSTMPTFNADALLKARTRQSEKDPIQFQLGGQTFTCLSVIPLGEAITVANLPEDTAVPSILQHVAVQQLLVDMIRKCVIPDQREAFDAALADPYNPVDAQALIPVVEFLTEAYTSRPFGQPTDSSPGRSKGGTRSSGGAGRTASKTSKTGRGTKA